MFIRSFVEAYTSHYGEKLPDIQLQRWGNVVQAWFQPKFTFRHLSHDLVFEPIMRIQGDEDSFMWEPGVKWRGGDGDDVRDVVRLTYAGDECKHDCPFCECSSDAYQQMEFTSPEEMIKWVSRLQ